MKDRKEQNLEESAEEEEIEVRELTGNENLIQRIQFYIDTNRNLIYGISIGVVIIVAAFFFLKARIEKGNEEEKEHSEASLSRILPYFESADYQKALNGDNAKLIRNEKVIGLIEIVSKYGSTAAGYNAALYAGHSYLSLGKANEALTYFEKAAKSTSKIVQEGAYAGIGASNEYLNKFREAAESYEKASSIAMTPALKDKYWLSQALCYEKLGEKEKSIKLYRDIVTENSSEYVAPAKAGLIRLGMIIE